jgi:hypothetical protein
MFVEWLNFIQSLLTSGSFILFIIFIITFFCLKGRIVILIDKIVFIVSEGVPLIREFMQTIRQANDIEIYKVFKEIKKGVTTEEKQHIVEKSSNENAVGNEKENTKKDGKVDAFGKFFLRKMTPEEEMIAKIFEIPTDEEGLKKYLEKVL